MNETKMLSAGKCTTTAKHNPDHFEILVILSATFDADALKIFLFLANQLDHLNAMFVHGFNV